MKGLECFFVCTERSRIWGMLAGQQHAADEEDWTSDAANQSLCVAI